MIVASAVPSFKFKKKSCCESMAFWWTFAEQEKVTDVGLETHVYPVFQIQALLSHLQNFVFITFLGKWWCIIAANVTK